MARYGISTYGTSTGTSASDLKNLALFTLGFVDKIDFSDLTNPVVEKVNRIYSTSLLFVLSNYPWKFILKRQNITSTRVDATDTNKYKYNYVLPLNFLTLRKAYRDQNYESPIAEFEAFDTYINTDANTCYVWYSAIVDEEDFPQYFIDYFKYKLALDLCFNLTGDTDLIQLLGQQEQAMLMSAKNVDAKQVQTRIVRNAPFIGIRG